MCSLDSLEMLESQHHLVTALSVESWPRVLQMIQKLIKGLTVDMEAEMRFPVSEAYSLPMNAKSLMGSVMANLRGSHHQLHMSIVEASSQRVKIDMAFSVPKCLRLARMRATPADLENVESGARTQGGTLERYLGRKTIEFGEGEFY